jgi:hypothetical protein
LGANIGYAYNLIRDKYYLFGGLGFLYSRQYREYYDDTFTEWSNYYWIEDGMISELSFEFEMGMYYYFDPILIGCSYSKGCSSFAAMIGYRFSI